MNFKHIFGRLTETSCTSFLFIFINILDELFKFLTKRFNHKYACNRKYSQKLALASIGMAVCITSLQELL